MSARWILMGIALLCTLGLTFSCRFEPDLSRFEPCADGGACPSGYTCLPEMGRCLPDCGAQGPCPGTNEDGGTDAGPDAGLPLSLATETLAPGVEKVPYTMELRAQGGTPPYQFRAGKPLPQGLTLDGGILSGTLSTPGTYPVTVEVSDADNPPAHSMRTYELRVRPKLRVAGPKTLVDGYPEEFYSEKVSAIGGTPPYYFTIKRGSLPLGLTLLDDGSVVGTPSETGNYGFTIKVTDSDPEYPQTAECDLELGIYQMPLSLTISTRALPKGRVGTSYQYTLRVAPESTVTWTLKTGSLPRGVGLDTRTGVLSGTPTEAIPYTFTLTVTDGFLSDEATFTVKVH